MFTNLPVSVHVPCTLYLPSQVTTSDYMVTAPGDYMVTATGDYMVTAPVVKDEDVLRQSGIQEAKKKHVS